jgi:hypothetical protein
MPVPVPRYLRRRSAATPSEIVGSKTARGMDVCLLCCCECCVLSGRVLCDESIPHPEESCQLW